MIDRAQRESLVQVSPEPTPLLEPPHSGGQCGPSCSIPRMQYDMGFGHFVTESSFLRVAWRSVSEPCDGNERRQDRNAARASLSALSAVILPSQRLKKTLNESFSANDTLRKATSVLPVLTLCLADIQVKLTLIKCTASAATPLSWHRGLPLAPMWDISPSHQMYQLHRLRGAADGSLLVSIMTEHSVQGHKTSTDNLLAPDDLGFGACEELNHNMW